jgi:hypothetical protein
MEVNNMLDVLHYLLDDDLSFVSGDHAKAKSTIRESLYKNIYNEKYKYAVSDGTNQYDFSDETLVTTGGAKSTEVKPYIPPTPFNPDSSNPFGAALRETPLG